MGFRIFFYLFLLFRALDFIIIFLAQSFIPYLGFFPYKEIAMQYKLPNFITSLANFDGAHYLLIAKNGYTTYQQAFFPLYPLLIRWLSPIFSNNLLLTGIIISNISFFAGLFVLSKYLFLLKYPISNIKYLFLFLLTFPTSFFFGAVYTEGLFFLLFVSVLYFLKKNKYLPAGIFALFAALTKFIGVFLIIPIIFQMIQNIKLKKSPVSFYKLLTTDNRLLITLISPFLGLSLYSLYLWKTIEDPLFFLNSQWAFGAHRSSTLIFLPQVYYRYLNIFFTANLNFQYLISLFEFVVFNFVLIILILDLNKNLKLKIKNYSLLSLNLFSFINLLLPTFTGTLSSIPRYALFSLSFYIYLSQIKNFSIKLGLAIIFAILHIIFFSFFIQGYFIS